MVEIEEFFAKSQPRLPANRHGTDWRRHWAELRSVSDDVRIDDKPNSPRKASSSKITPSGIDIYDQSLASSLSRKIHEYYQTPSYPLFSPLTPLYLDKFGEISPIPTWPTIDRLVTAWSSLEDDWDNCDALAPCPQQIRTLRSFVFKCEHEGIKEPRGFITSDTEIGFHWDGFRKASVSFLFEGKFLAFCPRENETDVRISGPFDIATCSMTLFSALRRIK